MLAIKLLGFAIGSTVLISLINKGGQSGQTNTLLIRMTCCGIIIVVTLVQFKDLYKIVTTLADKSKLKQSFLDIIIKSVGIAYTTEIASDLCTDAGEVSLANRVNFAGNILILCTSIPILKSLLDLITKVLN